MAAYLLPTAVEISCSFRPESISLPLPPPLIRPHCTSVYLRCVFLKLWASWAPHRWALQESVGHKVCQGKREGRDGAFDRYLFVVGNGTELKFFYVPMP